MIEELYLLIAGRELIPNTVVSPAGDSSGGRVVDYLISRFRIIIRIKAPVLKLIWGSLMVFASKEKVRKSILDHIAEKIQYVRLAFAGKCRNRLIPLLVGLLKSVSVCHGLIIRLNGEYRNGAYQGSPLI